MSQGPTPPAREPPALLPALPDASHTPSWTEALDSLNNAHLPQTQRVMDELFERFTYSLANEQDASAVYSALDRAEEQLVSLAHFLTTSGLAGLPVNKDRELKPDDMAATSRRLFEQRARMSEATALVSSIFSPH